MKFCSFMSWFAAKGERSELIAACLTVVNYVFDSL